MPDAGCRMPDAGCRMPDAGCRMPDAGCRMPIAERDMIVTTTNDLTGYRIVRTLGIAKGLTVRSRSVVGNIGAAIQILFGGNISVYTKLAEQTRQEAYDLLIQNAEQMGANAILAFRYDANEIASAVTEVLAYGTAVVVEPLT
jgi:uncharacterized protein YbjQ (UPF0145 family)